MVFLRKRTRVSAWRRFGFALDLCGIVHTDDKEIENLSLQTGCFHPNRGVHKDSESYGSSCYNG